MLYDIPIQKLPRTSPRTIARLTTVGIVSILALLENAPFRYEDYREHISITDISGYTPYISAGDEEYSLLSKGKVTIRGSVHKRANLFTRRGFSMQKITLADETGRTTLTWFNQPFLLTIFKEGANLAVSGSIKNNNGLAAVQPEAYDIVSAVEEPIHTGRIVPVYSTVPGVSMRTLREKIFAALYLFGNDINEYLPEEIVLRYALPAMTTTLKNLHFPSSHEAIKDARERMSFNELFSIQLKTKMVRKEWKQQHIEKHMDGRLVEKVQKFIAALPYTLTGAQKKTVKEIIDDMQQLHPMNRLLQGDVGSGKTIVAATAALFAFLNKQKTLYMAPTEILAQQQIETLRKLFSLLSEKDRPHLCLITHASNSKHNDFADADIIVGTHALISSKRTFKNIGLVIIDEQHKFGVVQRGALKKKGLNPHMLSLTATPIPRTVLLTLYGELDVSTIDEFPMGRRTIKTHYVPESKRQDGYVWIKKELAQSHQVFVVCPFIDQSETETLQSVKAATQEIKKIQKVLSGYSVELLHGRLPALEKEKIMRDFSEGRLDILVSTPVVEVGIDVPNATVIIIEGAERFGLAQLHQLRGRVGRSDTQSYCLLFTTTGDDNPHQYNKRLKTFCTTHNGFELARYDLRHRGGGNIFGTQQHGFSPIALEKLLDTKLVAEVQGACEIFVERKLSYQKYPYLKQRLNAYHIEEIAQN